VVLVTSKDPHYNFEANPTLDELIAQQGKGEIVDVGLSHGDFWPEDERIEDFLIALYEWRSQKLKQVRSGGMSRACC